MSDAFTPQVRALLDRLEPPALSADFADRLVAKAEALSALPPLPSLRKPNLRRGRRFALAVGLAGLVGVAAAAAVVPADAWRRIPVIGEIVELFGPARDEAASTPAPREAEPVVREVSEQAAPEAAPLAEPEIRPVPETNEAVLPVEESAVEPAPRAEVAPSAALPERVERARDVSPPPVREIPVAERRAPAETREAAAVADTRIEPAPERIRPADTSETRQQIRERTASERQTARERMERRERRISRLN